MRIGRVGFHIGIAVFSVYPLLLQAAPVKAELTPAGSRLVAAETHAGNPSIRTRAQESGSEIQTPTLRASFDRRGNYAVVSKSTHLRVDGSLPEAVTHLGIRSGLDSLGAYQQIEAVYGSSARVAIVRLYRHSSTALFLDRHKGADANSSPFPEFHPLPQTLGRASYRVFKFSPIDFGKLDSQGPWLFFDRQRNTLVLSPADNFLVADLEELPDGRLSSGIAAQIAMLPAGFTHRTLLSFGTGINRTIGDWGMALQKLEGKRPVANDADVVLNKFGYWTDNGASYYYKFDPALGYEGTLLAIRNEFQKLGVPLAYMQLDSWWYPKQDPKGKGDSGTMVYRADPTIFPDGLDAFHRKLGLPLVTHGRWIAHNSPYRDQYRMSDNVIIDPRFWNSTADYLKQGGVTVYEQDWLNHNARPAIDIEQSHAYLAEMANSMRRDGIGIQYCMPLPAYFMASTQFPNLRTIRTGDDHFMRARYDTFLYTSALARAVGLWPWSDVFMSSEQLNLILSTLSAGPVGTGDALGAIDAENLKRVMRQDSVILKPDTSLMPVDAMYLADSVTGLDHASAPMVAMAQTNFGKLSESYLLSYSRTGNDSEAVIPYANLAIDGPVYAWDWVSQKGKRIDDGQSLHVPYENGWGYEVLAKIDKSGIALVGDTSKIVPLARKRFVSVSTANDIDATLAFASGETSVPVTIYAEHAPHVIAIEGTVRALHYDSVTDLATFTVSPSRQSRAKIRIW